jgi:hypothetical protein
VNGLTWLTVSDGLCVAYAVLPVVVAWPVLVRAADAANRRLFLAALVAAVIADGVGAVPAWTTGQTSFVVGTVGRAVILAGIALATAGEPHRAARQP